MTRRRMRNIERHRVATVVLPDAAKVPEAVTDRSPPPVADWPMDADGTVHAYRHTIRSITEPKRRGRPPKVRA